MSGPAGETKAGHPADRDPRGPAAATETARYIGEMTEELAELARSAGLDDLAFLLDLAKLEATNATAARRRRG